MKQAKNWAIVFLISSIGLTLSGCACLNTPEPKKETIDPYESVNRVILSLIPKQINMLLSPLPRHIARLCLILFKVEFLIFLIT